MELITHAYFDERDFSKVSLLEETHRNLNIGLTASLVQGSQVFLGMFSLKFSLPWFPPGLKNLKKWEGIFQSGKSQGILTRLEKSGNFTENTGKIRKNYIGKFFKILEKSGKFISQ